MIDYTEGHPTLSENIWATIVIVQWLQQKCAEYKREWKTEVEKAESWLKRQKVDVTKIVVTFNNQ
jgi:hypothetical protein